MKIGVFDSGIGGLVVLNELIKKYPNSNYIYYGDTLHLPYGEKTKEELLSLVSKIINFFIEKKVDLIVIACGTVSSTIYKELTGKYFIPVINIINCTIDKIKSDNIKDLAVIATNNTINSHIFKNNLININVLELACPKFVPLLEKNIGDKRGIIDEYLRNIKKSRINNIVLGCTHYPLLEKDIRNYLEYPVNIYNMGKIVADKININDTKFNLEMYFSLIDDNLIKNVNSIIDCNYKIEERVL